MEMTEGRLKHSLEVARKMTKAVREQPERYSFDERGAFALGMVHDIGYEFSAVQTEHAHIGGGILKNKDISTGMKCISMETANAMT